MKEIFKKLKKAIRHPEKILPYFWQKKWWLYYWFSRDGHSPMPSTIFISINSVCNAKCKMCDVGQGIQDSTFFQNLICQGRPEISLKRLKQLVDEVKEFHPKIAIISTEPLLYRDLVEFAEYVISSDLKLQITTNGILLKKFAKKFVEIGLHELWVSLDGPPKIHNEIRGIPNIFELATSGIKLIQEEKERTRQKYPKLYINYTISNYNYHCLVDFMESIKGLKIDGICFSHLNFVTKEMAEIHNNSFAHIGRATPTTLSLVNLDEINPKILSKQLITVKKKYSKMNINFSPSIFSSKEIETYYRQPLKIISQDRCTVVWESAQIIANGDVIPITRCFNVKLGNIYENSFREIWNGYKMRQFRKILKKYRHFPVCSRCCALLK